MSILTKLKDVFRPKLTIDYPRGGEVKIRHREIKPGHDRIVVDMFSRPRARS